MKLKFILASMALATVGTGLYAQSASDLRVYINPGHGSWTGNDRPMNTIGRKPYSDPENVDTTGFFETNTNIRKGLALLDKLAEYGLKFDRSLNQTNENPARVGAALDMRNNIVMSHVKAGPYPTVKMGGDSKLAEAYNRNLSEVAAEVEANNFDLFISIHSNAAAGTTANYPLFLFRGEDSRAEVAGSDEMAKACWKYAYGNEHMQWSYYSMTNMNIRGDWDFYGGHSVGALGYDGYLGVLKHGAPGFLVEGYFHTYDPARQRAMNFDVCRHEGTLYARGIADYFRLEKEKTGDIYGIVRDLHEKFTHTGYKPASRTDDVYKPLNGVTVNLLKDGKVVKTLTTDNEWNGAFVFTGLEPGEYSLTYSAEGYKEAFEEYLAPVTVTAANTTYVKAFLESESYTPPAIVYVNYPDPMEGTGGYGVAGKYVLDDNATVAEPLKEQLAGKTVRRQIVRNDRLFVLALDEADEPYIYMVNLTDNTVAQISTEGLTLEGNKDLKISDIAFTADHVLLATSYGENQFGNDQIKEGDERGECAIYKWANDDKGLPAGAPQKWFGTQNSGNYYNALTGKTLAYSGTAEEGAAMITAQTTGSSTSLRFVELGVANGTLATTTFINKNVSAESNYTANKLGDDFQLTVSPLADNQWVIDGSKTTALEWQTAGQNIDAPLMGQIDAELMAAEANGASFFKFAGRSLMVAPAVNNGEVTGALLFDVTDGLNQAKVVETNFDITPIKATYASAAGRAVVETNDEGAVTNQYFDFWLVADGKVMKKTTKGVEQPKFRAEYAYDLSAVRTDNAYNVTFKTTGDAVAANVVLEKDGSEPIVYPVALTPGEKEVSMEILAEEIPEGEYTWKVEVASNPIPSANLVFSALSSSRGLVIDRNPESKYFGRAYVGDPYGTKGIYVFNPDLTQVNDAPYFTEDFKDGNTASPYRLAIRENGDVVIADWSDKHAGLWVFDPADNTKLTSLFAGEKDAAGAYTYEGKVIGGGSTGAWFHGNGADQKMFAFVEDYPTGNSGNWLVGYNVGEAKTITEVPFVQFEDSKSRLANTDVNVLVNEKGVWCAQNRGAGNNSVPNPGFILYDFDGSTLFNSSDLADLDGCARGGMALSDDCSKFAVIDASKRILIYNVTWEGKKPTFEKDYAITVDAADGSCYQMQFDQAGNLFVANRNGFKVYALPEDTPLAVTPAPASMKITGMSGIDENVAESAELRMFPNPATTTVNVEAGAEIESVAVYSLAGAMMNVDVEIFGTTATVNVADLAAGTYLIRVNGQTAKIIKR